MTCSQFEASITIYDKSYGSLSSVNFSLATEFDISTNNTDLRTVTIEAFQPSPGSQGFLEINAGSGTECQLQVLCGFYKIPFLYSEKCLKLT